MPDGLSAERRTKCVRSRENKRKADLWRNSGALLLPSEFRYTLQWRCDQGSGDVRLESGEGLRVAEVWQSSARGRFYTETRSRECRDGG